MPQIRQEIALNFIPLLDKIPPFLIYRRLVENEETKFDEKIHKYNLPENDSGQYQGYWVSLSHFENADKFKVNQNDNIYLTQWYLSELLKNRAKEESLTFMENESRFNHLKVSFITERFDEGKRIVWLEPYYLKTKNQFGFLIGFRFFLNEGEPFNKKIQQYSFSIDNDGKSNKNYHIDVIHYINKFMKDSLVKLNPIFSSISLSDKLTTIKSGLLSPKKYQFKGGQISNSQFTGIMKYGPYQEVDKTINYIFLFREAEKPFVIELMKALNGDKYHTFKGLDKFGLNKIKTSQNFQAIRVVSFTSEEIEKAFSQIEQKENSIIISVFPEKEEEFYYALKNKSLREDILLQVIHSETIFNEYVFKWSVSSIALQIFSKLGGTPWLVRSEEENTLMIGIGNSISINAETKEIERFYAYSVLVESTGKFVSINALANQNNRKKYLNEIAQSIAEIVAKNKNYKKIVFHLPQKIRGEEIKAIENVIQQNSDIEITLIRINDGSKFFGFNKQQNSLIPFESTFASISDNEFLLWTEGLNFHSSKATKRYAHPLYIHFLYSTSSEIRHETYLQEILNLSGANFRGFNAKALPVSLFYPKLISDFNKNFSEFNLDQIVSNNNKPWFL